MILKRVTLSVWQNLCYRYSHCFFPKHGFTVYNSEAEVRYIGSITRNRNTLPLYHYLRYFGQTGKCCPHGYYEPEGKYFNEEVFINDDTPISAASLTKKNDMGFCMPCDNNLDRYEQIKDFLLDDKGVYTWHHKPGSVFFFKRSL